MDGKNQSRLQNQKKIFLCIFLIISFVFLKGCGTIAAASNNATGLAGVAWNTRILPLRVLGYGGGTSYDIIQAVRYAAGLSTDYSGVQRDAPVDVINLSLGGSTYSQSEAAVYEEVREQGVIVVAAAGNNATTDAMYPAAYEGVISVSAATIDEDLASYSSYGESVDVAAPGGASSDTNGDGYAAMPMQPFPSAHTRPMSTGLAWSPWIRMPTAWALIENVDFITDINLNLSTDSQSVTPALPLYLETE